MNYELAVPTNDYDLQEQTIKMTAYCQMNADLTEPIKKALEDFGFVRIEQKGAETYFDFDSVVDIDNRIYWGDEVYYDSFEECRQFAISEEKRLIGKMIKDFQVKNNLPKIFCVIEDEEEFL